MTAICIGGVCVPYTAILPLLALSLRWIAAKLAAVGIIPEKIARKLGVDASTTKASESHKSLSGNGNSTARPTSRSVTEIESSEDWNATLTSHPDRYVVAKFTATWCDPCKKIEPFYHDLSSKYDATFVTLDVDELDEVAAEQKVAAMPTFVVFRGTTRAGSLTGANEDRLEKLIAEHCPARVRE